jgi:hypothetical protein
MLTFTMPGGDPGATVRSTLAIHFGDRSGSARRKL